MSKPPIAMKLFLSNGGFSSVQSVNGKSGEVVLLPSDIGAETSVNASLNYNQLNSLIALRVTSSDLADTLELYATNVSTNAGDVVTYSNAVSYTNQKITDFQNDITAQLNTKADLINGVLPTSQLPSLAIISFLGEVSSQAEMLALQAESGDWCIRSDLGQHFILTALSSTGNITDWTGLQMPTGAVTSVNGQSGEINLGYLDVGAEPAGSVASAVLGLQDQLNNKSDTAAVVELVAFKADKAITVTAGTGLFGGGNLSANRTLSIANTGVAVGTYGSATKSVSLTINAQGQITAVSENTISGGGSDIVWTDLPVLAANNWASGFVGGGHPLQIGKDSNGVIWLRGVFRSTISGANTTNICLVPTTHKLRIGTNIGTNYQLPSAHVQYLSSNASPITLGASYFDAATQVIFPNSGISLNAICYIGQCPIGPAL